MPSTKEIKFLGNLTAVCAILFGLLAAFGGIDITALGALVGIIILIRIIAIGDYRNLFIANKASFGILFFLTLLCLYMILGRVSGGGNINATVKNLISNAVLFGFLIYFFHKAPKNNEKIFRAIIAGFGLCLLPLLTEAIDGYYIYNLAKPNNSPLFLEVSLGRGSFITIVLFWPALLAMKRLGIDKKFQIFAFILTLILSAQFGIDLNLVIFVLAGFSALVATKFPRLAITTITMIAGILVSLAPIIYPHIAHLAKNYTQNNLPLSYGRRADMWIYAAEKIKDKPLFGWGLDSSRTFQEKVSLGGYEWSAIQMHPHSAPLHIWLEGGLIGAILVVAIIGASAIAILRSRLIFKENAWAASALFTSILSVWSLSHAIWEQWLWAVSMLVFGFLFAASYTKTKKTSSQLEEI